MDHLHVAVWWRERAGLGDISRAAHENVVLRNGISRLVAVQVGRDSKLGVGEVALLDKDLGTHARVDSRGRVVLEAGAVYMRSAESDRWQARVDVGKVVVMIGDAEVSSILGTVAIGVTDERSLPLSNGLVADIILQMEYTNVIVKLVP